MLGYVQDELIKGEMNVFDAALALIALGHLGAETASFTPALACIVRQLGEGGRHGPYRAYEWNKMKTPTRILVGGPEVTSAFVLMGLALARKAMRARFRARLPPLSLRFWGESLGRVGVRGCLPNTECAEVPLTRIARAIRPLPASGAR